MCTVGVLEEMSVPAQANGSTLLCASPPWGSKFAASSLSSVTENVTEYKLCSAACGLSVVTSVLLFDSEDEIPRPSPYSTANMPWGFPDACNTIPMSSLFVFTALETSVFMHVFELMRKFVVWQVTPMDPEIRYQV